MNKVEEYIRDYTRACSNEMDFKENGKPTYHPWLTPEHARAVAQIAGQEVIDKACEWLEDNLPDKTSVICSGVVSISFDNVLNGLRKAMETDK